MFRPLCIMFIIVKHYKHINSCVFVRIGILCAGMSEFVWKMLTLY